MSVENCGNKIIATHTLVFVGCAKNGVIEVHKIGLEGEKKDDNYLVRRDNMGEDWSVNELLGGKQIYLFIPILNNPDGLSKHGTLIYYEFLIPIRENITSESFFKLFGGKVPNLPNVSETEKGELQVSGSERYLFVTRETFTDIIGFIFCNYRQEWKELTR